MTQIENIRQEIDRRYEENREKARYDDYYRGMNDGLDSFESFLDTLQEPEFPATDEEMEAFLASHPKVEVPEKYKTPDWLYKELEQEPEARQLLQGSPMPEDTVLFNKRVQEGRRLEREEKDGCMERTSPFILSESFNWDTFRAEAAKNILCAIIQGNESYDSLYVVHHSVEMADSLIKQLRNNEKD